MSKPQFLLWVRNQDSEAQYRIAGRFRTMQAAEAEASFQRFKVPTLHTALVVVFVAKCQWYFSPSHDMKTLDLDDDATAALVDQVFDYCVHRFKGKRSEWTWKEVRFVPSSRRSANGEGEADG
jgi:hypothetical protein